ncbi:MAG TPA: hypothetical protein PK395_18950 [bacterium]|nr:hypothetical protein [bacterium]HQP99976.1 hypothetical protein [bacterium]
MPSQSSGKQEIKELHVCLVEGTDIPFFASMVSLDGFMADLRSSTEVEKGATIHLAPVPEHWKGGKFTADEVRNSPNMKSGQVSRCGRGNFTLRLLTEEAQHMRKQIRDGSVGMDDLIVKTIEAGAVTTLQVSGGLSISSVTKIQAGLRKLGPSQQLALLDLTDMTATSDAAVKFLVRYIRECEEKGKHACFLIRPNSRIVEILASGDEESMIEIHTDREMAVMSLIRKTLES